MNEEYEELGGYDDFNRLTVRWNRPLYWRRIAEQIRDSDPEAKARFRANAKENGPLFAYRVRLLTDMTDQDLGAIINTLNNHQADGRRIQHTI